MGELLLPETRVFVQKILLPVEEGYQVLSRYRAQTSRLRPYPRGYGFARCDHRRDRLEDPRDASAIREGSEETAAG